MILIDRVSQFPNRRRLIVEKTIVDAGGNIIELVVNIVRDEGIITEQGTLLAARPLQNALHELHELDFPTAPAPTFSSQSPRSINRQRVNQNFTEVISYTFNQKLLASANNCDFFIMNVSHHATLNRLNIQFTPRPAFLQVNVGTLITKEVEIFIEIDR